MKPRRYQGEPLIKNNENKILEAVIQLAGAEVIQSNKTTTTTTTEYTIFHKYRLYINQCKSGYIRGLSYAEAVEILRYVEGRTGRNIPINYSCGNCMMSLIEMFSRLEQ